MCVWPLSACRSPWSSLYLVVFSTRVLCGSNHKWYNCRPGSTLVMREMGLRGTVGQCIWMGRTIESGWGRNLRLQPFTTSSLGSIYRQISILLIIKQHI